MQVLRDVPPHSRLGQATGAKGESEGRWQRGRTPRRPGPCQARDTGSVYVRYTLERGEGRRRVSSGEYTERRLKCALRCPAHCSLQAPVPPPLTAHSCSGQRSRLPPRHHLCQPAQSPPLPCRRSRSQQAWATPALSVDALVTSRWTSVASAVPPGREYQPWPHLE